ncbi:MAG: mannose-6-phosphate isomerase, class I, partial [Thermodesulfobacteriota bacterium]
ILGAEAAAKFNNTLPFLFKVLAAAHPLSIQAHPDRSMAETGFKMENQRNIPIDAPHRNYRDPWPKPEIICALEPFVAANGFRPAESIVKWFETICPEKLAAQITMLKEAPGESGIKKMFESLVRMPAASKRSAVDEAATRAAEVDAMEGEWVVRLSRLYPDDIGVLCPLFLNLVRLEPHTAMFLPPGRMHAYLEGVGIELMANSDNVLRGGLTGKHVDIEALLDTVRFDPSPIDLLRPVAKNKCESRYPTDAEEFLLSVVQTENGKLCRFPEDHGLEILLCIKGTAEITAGQDGSPLTVEKGGSVIMPASVGSYEIKGDSVFYKAAIPDIPPAG